MWHWCYSIELKSQNELKNFLLEKEEEEKNIVYDRWSWFGEIRIPSVSELQTASEASPFYNFHYSYM